MISRDQYTQHSAYTDPGAYSALLDSLPTDIHKLTAVVRNVIVHYRSGTALTDDRLAEIDNRWVENILATDQQRFPISLDVPRPQPDRVAGCCRDFTLLTVAALRHRGVPGRSRVGFSRYLGGDGFHNDHVIVDYWNGERWVFVDSQLEPGPDWPFDTHDIPRLVGTNPSAPPYFWTAAQAWMGFRSGAIDVDQYGSEPDSRLHGGWFVRNYVLYELAHRQRDELLLWDLWGAMSADLDGDIGLVDEIACLLLAADDGDDAAEAELAHRYATDDRLHPGATVRCLSPSGVDYQVNLNTREPVGAKTPIDGTTA